MNESHMPFVVDSIDRVLMNADNVQIIGEVRKQVNEFMEQFILYPEMN
jgi:glycine hydroxymethyltransferase